MQQNDRGAGATETLARFVAETSYSTLPADVVAAAKIGILDGVLSETCRHYRGSIANPMDRAERLAKVVDCARRRLDAADIERVIGMAEALEALPDVRALMLVLGHRSAKEDGR